jgi:hypothetical protein
MQRIVEANILFIIIVIIIIFCIVLIADVSEERFVGVWRTLVDILEGSLLSPR